MKLMKWRSQLSEDEIAENKKCKITLNTLLDIFILKSCWEIVTDRNPLIRGTKRLFRPKYIENTF